MQQVKEHGKNLHDWRSAEEIHSLPEREFRIMIVKIIQNLENKMNSQINRLETWIKKIKEIFNKVLDLELMIVNCHAGQDFESPLDSKKIKPVNPKRKSILNIHWKDWCWSWSSNSFGHLIWRAGYWKRPWCWERLRETGEGDNSGWDGWMASRTQWTWVWASSRSWWWTGKPGVLQFMRWQNQTRLSDWTTTTKKS